LIGVIDNGYDFFNPDLKGQIQPGYYFTGGYHAEFFEGVAHGTWMASMMVAKDDDQGMVGLAPECRLLTASQGMIEHTLIKMRNEFLANNPGASFADWQKEMVKQKEVLAKFGPGWIRYQITGTVRAIRYLVDHQVKVINFSGGLMRRACPDDQLWQELQEAFAYAAEKNVIIVLSAGNHGVQVEDYPGNPESMIVAGASLLDDTRWAQEMEMGGTKIKMGSCYGKRLTAMAPVENLVVCMPHDERFYQTNTGPMGRMEAKFEGAYRVNPNGATSSAAPIVTSLVALIHSLRSDLDAKSIVKIIQQGCDDIGEQGFDIHTGYGRANFGKTLQLARTWNRKSSNNNAE
jgi:subtilisin family serine protease